jgi:hypothetical protein
LGGSKKYILIMAFNIGACAIPTFYCGNNANIPEPPDNMTRYTRRGTAHECLKKGIGTGIHKEREKNLAADSLQRIKYVGENFDRKFATEGIRTRAQLKTYIRGHTREQNNRMLRRVFTKAGGGIDKRGYNSTLVYLHNAGIGNLPQCSRI